MSKYSLLNPIECSDSTETNDAIKPSLSTLTGKCDASVFKAWMMDAINNGANVNEKFAMTIEQIKILFGVELDEEQQNTLARGEIDMTPLLYSIKAGDEYLLSFLIEKGADINLCIESAACNISALQAAVLGDNMHIIQSLLAQTKQSVKINAVDASGFTPLHYAQSCEVVGLLLDAGANINAQDNDGRTLLFTAENLDVATELVKRGADITLRDKLGMSPIVYFMKNRDFDRVSMFLELKPDYVLGLDVISLLASDLFKPHLAEIGVILRQLATRDKDFKVALITEAENCNNEPLIALLKEIGGEVGHGLEGGVPATLTRGLTSGLTSGLPSGLTSGLPSGSGLPNSLTSGLPSGLPSGSGLPNSLTSGLPPELSHLLLDLSLILPYHENFDGSSDAGSEPRDSSLYSPHSGEEARLSGSEGIGAESA